MVQSPLVRILGAILLGGSAAVLASAGLRVFASETGQGIALWPDLLWMAPALVIAFLLHEIGHAVFGACAGLRPMHLSVGPVNLIWPLGAWPSVVFKRSTQGGFLIAVPRRGLPSAYQLFVLVLGGPLMSGLLAYLSWMMALKGGNMAAFWFMATASHSFVALSTLIPFGPSHAVSDGARLWGLITGTAAGKAFKRGFERSAIMRQAVRPRDWPVSREEVLSAINEAQPGSQEHLSALFFAMCYTLDHGEEEVAKTLFLEFRQAAEGSEIPATILEHYKFDMRLIGYFLKEDSSVDLEGIKTMLSCRPKNSLTAMFEDLLKQVEAR